MIYLLIHTLEVDHHFLDRRLDRDLIIYGMMKLVQDPDIRHF